jgi:hypothetical protein
VFRVDTEEMKRSAILWSLLVMSISPAAYADVPNEPCDGKEEGDVCERNDGGAGVCDANGQCVAEDEDDGGGCSVTGLGTKVAAGSLSLAALAGLAMVARRRRA